MYQVANRFAYKSYIMIKFIRERTSLIICNTAGGSNNTHIRQQLVFRVFSNRVHFTRISMIRKRFSGITDKLVGITFEITVSYYFLVNMICIIYKEMMPPIIKSLSKLSGT